jgi:OHCU decarboxylase
MSRGRQIPEPRLVALDELNALPRDGFVEAVKPLFEAATPLADALSLRRPFSSYEQLIDIAEQVTASLAEPSRIDIVNAHPRIGASAAVLRQTSHLSSVEQGAEDPAVDAALADLNATYEQRFGFRFVVFVNRRPRSAILEVLRQRLDNARDRELQTATAEMFLIARDRLRTLTSSQPG